MRAVMRVPGLSARSDGAAFTLIPGGDEGTGRANTITHPLVYLVTDRGDDDVQNIAAQLVEIATEPRINTLHTVKSAHLAVVESQSLVPLHAQDRWIDAATTVLLAYANSQPNQPDYGVWS